MKLDDLRSVFGPPLRSSAHLRGYIRIAAEVLGRSRLARPPVRAPFGDGSVNFASEIDPSKALDYAKEVTRQVADHFEFWLPRLALRFSTLKEHAGHIQRRGDTWYVDIDKTYERDRWAMTAILAHEFAHVVLHDRGIRLEPTIRNEYLTDTLAALAGFGPIMYQACERQEVQYLFVATRTITRRLGYLSREDIGTLLAIQRRITTGLPKRRLQELAVMTDAKLSCVACNGEIPLPVVDARVRVRCPTCGLREDLRIRHAYVIPEPTSRLQRVGRAIRQRLDAFNGFSLPA